MRRARSKLAAQSTVWQRVYGHLEVEGNVAIRLHFTSAAKVKETVVRCGEGTHSNSGCDLRSRSLSNRRRIYETASLEYHQPAEPAPDGGIGNRTNRPCAWKH